MYVLQLQWLKKYLLIAQLEISKFMSKMSKIAKFDIGFSVISTHQSNTPRSVSQGC